MSLDQVANFAKVTVSIGYNAAATSIALSSGHGATLPDPAVANYNLVWWNATDYADPSDDPNREIVRVTAKSTDTLTVTRAQEGTSASTKNTSAKTYKMILGITAKMITDISTLLAATPSLKFITVTGTIPGTSFTMSGTKTGKSVIIQNNTTFFEDVDYTVSGTALTWLYTLTADYSSPLTMICVG